MKEMLTRVVSVLLVFAACLGQGLAQGGSYTDGGNTIDAASFGFLNLYTVPRMTPETEQAFLASMNMPSINAYQNEVNVLLRDLKVGSTTLGYYWLQGTAFPHDNIKKAGEVGLDVGIRLYPTLAYPADENAWFTSVKSAVEAYDGDGVDDYSSTVIKYWQVAVEPNFTGHWTDTPENFAKLLSRTYDAIKSANPNAVVILGGEVLPQGTDTFFVDVFKYLGGEQKFDMVDVHYYGAAKEPAYPQGSGLSHVGYARQIDNFRKKLKDAGFSDNIPIWTTEIGTFAAKLSGGPNLFIQTEKEQAIEMVKIHGTAFSRKVARINWAFGLTDVNWWPVGYFRHTGLIYSGTAGYPNYANELEQAYPAWTKKLSYYTYKKMVEVLGGCAIDNVQTLQESGDVYVYKFTRNGTPVYVAWWDYFNDPAYTPGKIVPVTLTGLPGNTVLATEAVPRFSAGAEVTDYATAFRQQTLAVTGGTVTLQLGENPVFVEGPAVSLRVNGNPNATVTVSNPVTVDYTLRGGQGQEFFLALDAPAMGIPWAYMNAAGKWIALPANLADVTPFTTAPADGNYLFYSGTVPAGAYTLCLGYDTVPNSRLDMDSAVYDCVTATVR